MLVCLRRGLSLLRQHPPRFLPPLRPRPACLLFLSSLHLSAAAAMGENSAAGKDAKGKAPAPPPPPTVVPDEAYLEAVTQKRIRLFKEIQARQALERLNIGGEPIKITLPDGAVKEGKKWISTPMDIAKEISSGLAASCLIAQVNGTLWDMARPLEGDCELKLFKFDSNEGRDTFWHSSAHILGESLERAYGCKLCIGPCTTRGEGFYYDAYYNDVTLNEAHFGLIQTQAQKAVAEKQPFERIEVSRVEALEMFAENKFKVEIINELPEDKTITVYRCGPLVDLCRGPHIPSTSFVKAFACLKASSSYWRGKADRESLQRVYGISFPDSKRLKEYQHLLEEAKKRDHRLLGQSQDLFFFHQLSPGSCFFLPNGAIIYNKLMDFLRQQYRERGYQEVLSPNIYNMQLWETSGHAANYKENMFVFEIEKQEFGLKPMNCPGHCLMFEHRVRSYRELPLRMADFGVLHRNELSGALTGLTRVRRFQQDDAHIFCRENQIKDEVKGVLEFINYVYEIFGFKYELELSTLPSPRLPPRRTQRAARGEREREGEQRARRPKQKCKTTPTDGCLSAPFHPPVSSSLTRRRPQQSRAPSLLCSVAMAAGRACCFRRCLAVLVAAAVIFLACAEGVASAGNAKGSRRRQLLRQRQVHNHLKRLNKAPLVSIESPDGDIIDCVHISNQPAFDHPFLKNHTIQMRPAYHPEGMYDESKVASRQNTQPITQMWHQNGKCPENTIPVRRTKKEDVLRASSVRRYGKKRHRSTPNPMSVDPDMLNESGHQHAIAYVEGDKYYGAKATINVWQPRIEQANEFSLSQLWILGGSFGQDLNSIEAGWQVSPDLYGDNNTRLFTYWTSDAYQATGCYNLLCAGFIQINNQIAMGASIFPISNYGGSQYDINILVWKDPKEGNWWLQFGNDYVLGYWPSFLFSYLADSASMIEWGGEVVNSEPDGSHTSTQMGSGHFPEEGFGKCSYFRNIQVVDSSNNLKAPRGVGSFTEQSNCYDVQNGNNGDWGTYFYYGGPGKNLNCP